MENSCHHRDESSSEEEDDRLKEALDPSMFTEKPAIKQNTNKPQSFTSYKDNILDVTPEFQSYIGKNLANMLDKNLKECEGKSFEMSTSRSGGIKLFDVSSIILTDDNFCVYSDVKVDPITRKKARFAVKRDNYNETTEKERISAAAVSPEWILEKHCVKGWSKPKGKEIILKKNIDGVLEVVAPSFVSK
ncbi:uncharacterized protein LOC135832132 [Planococcus citri]|uniref:uncharacterized protein LOC135832132 n=1 Tax=Planococcus citri TaxID=170843 RepID=UPI0031F8A476